MSPQPPRLLIIDDDPTLVDVVQAIAREAFPARDDLAIERLVSADAALVAIRGLGEGRPHTALTVISDLHLPPGSVNGLEILAEVKRRFPAAKRVLMTSQDPLEFYRLLDEARLDAFVAKPFTFYEMHGLIMRLVSDAVRSPEARP